MCIHEGAIPEADAILTGRPNVDSERRLPIHGHQERCRQRVCISLVELVRLLSFIRDLPNVRALWPLLRVDSSSCSVGAAARAWRQVVEVVAVFKEQVSIGNDAQVSKLGAVDDVQVPRLVNLT